MKEIKFVNAGHNVHEPRSLSFHWALPQHAFLYFQGPVIVNGREVNSGACILYKCGTRHNYVTLKGFVNSYIGFHAPESLLAKLNIKTDKIIYPDNCREINSIIFDICQENSSKKRGFEENIQASVLKLLVAISRGTNIEDTVLKNSDMLDKMNSIRTEFLTNVASPPGFEELLKKKGISRTQGYKLYSRFFHSSPREELIWARLENSRNLIRMNPDMKIYEIAESCGFTNIPHFFRLFKQRYGYTPKDYANAIKLDNE